VVVPAGIGAIWLLSMGWLVRYEAFPHLFTHMLPGYRLLERRNPIVGDWWMKILLDSEQVGYSHTTLDFDETDPVRHYRIQNETVLALNVMGEQQHIRSSARVALDMLYQVQQFIFAYASGPYSVRILGQRVAPQRFQVGIYSPAGRYQTEVELPEGTVIADLMPESGMLDLRPGQQIALRTFNPATLSSSIVRIRALRYEDVEMDSEEVVRALVISIDYEGMQTISWLCPDGRVLRQETPFGLTLVACSAEEAAAYARKPATDVLGKTAIPTEGRVKCPRTCQSLLIRISGSSLQPEDLTTPRQQVLKAIDPNTVLLHVDAEGELSGRRSTGTLPETIRKYLRAGPFIQSDDPQIREVARRITGELSSPAERAAAICDWVYTHIEKTAASGIPSAVDVLHNLKGDCNEHAVLFTALARAAGLPARVLLGLVYSSDGFYYHAWPAVYLDGWHELDPTFGQQSVDATHIALTEGEGAAQLRLLGIIGRIRVRVEEALCRGEVAGGD